MRSRLQRVPNAATGFGRTGLPAPIKCFGCPIAFVYLKFRALNCLVVAFFYIHGSINPLTMPYPDPRLGKISFLSFTILLFALRGLTISQSQKNFQPTFFPPHNLRSYALYVRDTVQEHEVSGYVRRAANGDLVITVPQTASGRYKIRFFDERNDDQP